jgi:hypothetical protein
MVDASLAGLDQQELITIPTEYRGLAEVRNCPPHYPWRTDEENIPIGPQEFFFTTAFLLGRSTNAKNHPVFVVR